MWKITLIIFFAACAYECKAQILPPLHNCTDEQIEQTMYGLGHSSELGFVDCGNQTQTNHFLNVTCREDPVTIHYLYNFNTAYKNFSLCTLAPATDEEEMVNFEDALEEVRKTNFDRTALAELEKISQELEASKVTIPDYMTYVVLTVHNLGRKKTHKKNKSITKSN